jgi:hypothetical protein
MTKDTDGVYYLNYISWDSVVHIVGMEDDDYHLCLRDVANILRNGLSKSDPGVLSKYLWIHDQYVDAIGQFEKLGPKHRYRMNNPDNYAAVVNLPKLGTEARHAKRKIAEARRKQKAEAFLGGKRQFAK